MSGLPSRLRGRILAIVCTFCLLTATLAVHGCAGTASGQSLPVIIAAYGTPEQQVLAELTAQLLRAHGYSVTVKNNMQSAWHVRKALEAGSVHLAWQETEAVWFGFLGHDQPISGEASLFRAVKTQDNLYNIVWLTPLPWSNRHSVLLRTEVARASGIASIDDLATHISRVDPGVRLCVTDAVYRDARGIAGLERVYGFRFRNDRVLDMPPDEVYMAIKEKRCDATLGTAKDLALYEGDAVLLRDSRTFFSASSLAPTLHISRNNRYPELERVLGELTSALDAATLARMERQVTTGNDRLSRTVSRFLSQAGLTGQR